MIAFMDFARNERDIDMDKANIYEDLVAVWAAEGGEKGNPAFPTSDTETAVETLPRRDGKDRNLDPTRN